MSEGFEEVKYSIGSIFLPAALDDRMQAVVKRLGPEWPLGYFVRTAVFEGIRNPGDLIYVPGPFARRLSHAQCERKLRDMARLAAVKKFGSGSGRPRIYADCERGAYSDFVRSSIDHLVRYFETVGLHSGRRRDSLSGATSPEFRISASMDRRVSEYLARGVSEGRSRFLRQAYRYALRFPDKLPESAAGPFDIVYRGVPLSPGLLREVRREGAPDVQDFSRRAVELCLIVAGVP